MTVKHAGMIAGMTTALLASLAGGVTPGLWRHSTQNDFGKALRKNVVVNSHGDATLARKTDILLPAEQAPAVVSALAAHDNVLYAASGVSGQIFRSAGASWEVHAVLPTTIVTCLFVQNGNLLAGGGGERAGLYAVDPKGTVRTVFRNPNVSYVWAVAPGPNASLYLATGPNAELWRLDANGKSEVTFRADATLAKHLLCLAVREDGKLLAGTDEKGLVFEIDPKTKASRVILDADEREISVLLPDGRGGCYAATSDTARASSGPSPRGQKDGRAEAPSPSTAPEPETTPGEPSAPPSPTEPHAPPSPPRPTILARETAATEPPVQDIRAQAVHSPDGRVTITLPPGRSLPVLTREGRRVVMLQDLHTGDVREIPAENVRVEYAPISAASEESAAPASGPAPAAPAGGGDGSAPASSSGPGNAVYHVDAAGMVRTIHRCSGTIPAMVRQGERLIFAAGEEGGVYFTTLDGSLHGEVVDTDARQVTALAVGPNGELWFATSSPGSVGRLGPGPAETGTLTSPPLDARQIAQWGTLKLAGCAPDGARLTVATRSGNLTPAADATWSPWTKEFPLQEGFLPIASPAARFLQYRVTMTAAKGNSPVLESVEAIYQVANLAPVVSSVVVTVTHQARPPAPPAPTKLYRQVTLQASDPNGDTLVYRVQYRRRGARVWITAGKDLKEPKYLWDTRTVGDGEYLLRVFAEDSPSNPPAAALRDSRISEPVLVDNTPPRFENFRAAVVGRRLVLRGCAADALSRIVSLQYSLDSAAKWRPFLPADGICDSSREEFRAETHRLSPGAHQITVRATDVFGNIGYADASVVVRK